MDRIQIQLPPRLRAAIQSIAKNQEWSFSESMRRAGELLTERYRASLENSDKGWVMPQPLDMGKMKVRARDIKRLQDADHDARFLEKRT